MKTSPGVWPDRSSAPPPRDRPWSHLLFIVGQRVSAWVLDLVLHQPPVVNTRKGRIDFALFIHTSYSIHSVITLSTLFQI